MFAFQNCGKVNLMRDAGTTIAKGTTNTGGSTPDPKADPIPISMGGSHPTDRDGGGGVTQVKTGIPTCFDLVESGPQGLYTVTLTSESGAAVIVNSAKLFFGGNLSADASSINNEAQSIDFTLSQNQLAAGLVSGSFSGPDYSVLISHCAQ